ncbi:MAG TPA: response regulator [Candidatus Angelobacter sp.]|nr:response regulator [Candidatus Angelobacter sp.]
MNTLHIVLIEDNRLTKTMNEHLLRQAGYTVSSAEDGEQGLKLVQSVLPDVVLLDVLLPKLSGHEVLEHLKQDPVTADIPVIIITGLSRSYKEHFRHEGAFAFLTKAQLLDGIEPLLELLRQIEPRNRQQKASAENTDCRLATPPAHSAPVPHIPS